jgi:hypothetical protein
MPSSSDCLRPAALAVRLAAALMTALLTAEPAIDADAILATTQLPPAKSVEFMLGVAAMVCASDPGTYQGRDERFPEGCRWQSGVRLSLETADAQPLGTCVTSVSAWCHLAAAMAPVILREDLATVPAGYRPKQNPVLGEATANGAWVINVPTSSRPTPAIDAATLTIHSRFCPPGYSGPEETYFAVCHSTRPAFPQTVFLADVDHAGAGLDAAVIDEAGDVTFVGAAPGRYRVTQGLPPTIERLWVYCSRDWNPDDRLPAVTRPLLEEPHGRFATELALEPNANILCDFCAVPAADGGG